FATAGTVAVPRPDMPFTLAVPARGGVQIPRADQPKVPGHQALVPPAPPNAVTLAEAVDAGLLTSLAAARKAAQRPGFPAPVGKRGAAHLYDTGDLLAYQDSRWKGSR